jgi:predicted DNA binding CopG/RHH family protein
MKNIKLTKEEREIVKASELGVFKSILNLKKEKEKYSKIAQNTLRKNKSITIRLAERDLLKIKSKAAEEGLPYQTLITSVIHKYIY